MSAIDGAPQPKTQREGRAQRRCEGKTSAEVVTLVAEGTREVSFAQRRIQESQSGVSTTWQRAEMSTTPSCAWCDEELSALAHGLHRREPCGKRKQPPGEDACLEKRRRG